MPLWWDPKPLRKNYLRGVLGALLGVSAPLFPSDSGLRQIATNSRVATQINQTNKQMETRETFIAAAAVNGTLEVETTNWIVTATTGTGINNGNGTEIGPGAPLTVTCALEYPAGTFTQMLSGGATAGTAPDGGSVVHSCTAVIPVGARAWIRKFEQCSAGICITATQDTNNGEASNAAVSGLSDHTMSGTIANNSTGFIHRSGAIRASTSMPSVGIVGDSRAWGYQDGYGPSGNIGGVERGFNNRIPFVNCAVPGDRLAFFNANNAKRLSLLQRSVTGAVLQGGVNDFYRGLATVSVVQSIHATAAASLSFLSPIMDTTKEPITTSTDSWATTTNQTPDASGPNISSYNDWIRLGTSGVAGFYEIANSVESATDSHLWKAPISGNAITPDGLHPSNYGYAYQEAPIVVPTPFGVSPNALSLGGSAPAAVAGSAYSFTPTVSGGAGNPTFAFSGTLIAGLSFSASTGAISGTPTANGYSLGTITATDRSGATASLTLSGALTRDATAAAATSGAATSLTWNHTLSSSANLLIVALGAAVATNSGVDYPSATSVTAGGVAMTKIGRAISTGGVASGHDRMAELWQLSNPPTGTISIVANTPQGGAATAIGSGAESISYVNAPASPIGSAVTSAVSATGGSTTLSATTSDTTPGRTIAIACGRSTTALTPGSGETVISNAINNSNIALLLTEQANGSSAVSSATWTTADQGALIAVPIKSN